MKSVKSAVQFWLRWNFVHGGSIQAGDDSETSCWEFIMNELNLSRTSWEKTWRTCKTNSFYMRLNVFSLKCWKVTKMLFQKTTDGRDQIWTLDSNSILQTEHVTKEWTLVWTFRWNTDVLKLWVSVVSVQLALAHTGRHLTWAASLSYELSERSGLTCETDKF